MAEYGYVCPECIQGKCNNCSGVANIAKDDTYIPCNCKANAHPHRTHGAREALGEKFENGTQWVITQSISLNDRRIYREEWVPLPGLPSAFAEEDMTPEADPGELAFTVEDGRPYGEDIRLRPDAQINKDFLMDVEVKNDRGEWVPAIPTPIFLAFGRVQCHCGKKRRNKLSYMEHFSYSHILGMDD